MSGGYFDYKQYLLTEIADRIEEVLKSQGEKIEGLDYCYPVYSDEIQEKFREAIRLLKKAEVYVQRIDWLVSDDDGEEQFLKRLKEDLDDLFKE